MPRVLRRYGVLASVSADVCIYVSVRANRRILLYVFIPRIREVASVFFACIRVGTDGWLVFVTAYLKTDLIFARLPFGKCNAGRCGVFGINPPGKAR